MVQCIALEELPQLCSKLFRVINLYILKRVGQMTPSS